MLPEHINKLYHNEAMSSMALAKEVASKVNEIIDNLNKFSNDDLIWKQEQDGRVRKAVLYMKDNLLNSLNDLMVQLRDSGFIDDRIEYHCDNLKARLDNLIGSVQEGSTTLDAELIDLRVGADEVTYPNAGQSIRKQLSKRADKGIVVYDGEPTVLFAVGETTNITLTFPARANVFFNNKRYIIEPCVVEYTNTDTDIGLFNIVYDFIENKVSIRYASESHADTEVFIGWIHKDRVYMNGYGSQSSMTPDSYKPKYVTVWSNKEPYFDVVNDTYNIHIPMMFLYYSNSVIVIQEQDIEQVKEGVALYKLVYDVRSKNVSLVQHNKAEKQNEIIFGFINFDYGCISLLGHYNPNYEKLAPASMILGGSNNFVEFDTVNKIVRFPNDTLVLMKNESKFVQLADEKNNTSISYEDIGTSAVKICVNKFTGELSVHKYNEVTPYHYILLCSFRTNGAVSISVPYKWDGKPFNIALGVDTTNSIVKSINHRGYCTVAPENTLSAYRLSKKNGFKYVECDISFTADGVPVLLHDDTIDRTSNGTGNIAELTLEEVRAYDFGSWKSASYTGEKIPTFEEFMRLCRGLDLHPYIELKGAPTEAQVQGLIDIVKRYGMRGKVTYISFSPELLTYVKNYDDTARIGYVVNNIGDNHISTANQLKTDKNDVFIDSASYTEEEANRCINASISLEVWTINDSNVISSMNPYVNGVTSDIVKVEDVLYSLYMED